jgi:hypothetical protein
MSLLANSSLQQSTNKVYFATLNHRTPSILRLGINAGQPFIFGLAQYTPCQGTTLVVPLSHL